MVSAPVYTGGDISGFLRTPDNYGIGFVLSFTAST